MGTPIGTYIRSGIVLELPADVDALSLILAEHSESKVEVNPGELSLSIIREASMIQARKRIKDDLTPDKNLIQSIEALDEAHDILNLVSERLVTWNSQVTGKPRNKIEKILEGTPLPSQVNPLRDFYSSTKALISALSKYLDHESPRVFPHLVNLLGTQLAVRIVASAGGLFRLARMPASTIQLLGAEKALFRHLSDGSPPPKHGMLYQHPSVKRSKRKDKGRASRKLAAKIAIASKIEYYGEKNG